MSFITGKELLAGAMLSTGFYSNSDSGVIAGALIGSLFFVLTDKAFSKQIKWALFAVSFAVGVIAANFVANLATVVTPEGMTVHRPVAALITSAIGVKILIGLPDRIIDAVDQALKQAGQILLNNLTKLFRKGGDDDS